MRRSLTVVLAVVVVGLGACGDDDNTPAAPSFDEAATRAAVDRVYPGSPDADALVAQARADCTNIDSEFAFQVKVMAAVGSEFLELLHAGCPERLDQVLSELEPAS